MTPGEKRQANRIIRNGRTAEAKLFTLLEGLQEGTHDSAPFDWQCALDDLDYIDEYLSIARDLVKNIKREVDEK